MYSSSITHSWHKECPIKGREDCRSVSLSSLQRDSALLFYTLYLGENIYIHTIIPKVFVFIKIFNIKECSKKIIIFYLELCKYIYTL